MNEIHFVKNCLLSKVLAPLLGLAIYVEVHGMVRHFISIVTGCFVSSLKTTFVLSYLNVLHLRCR